MSSMPANSRNCFDPGVHDRFYLVHGHGCKGEVVARRKANHAANSGFGFGNQEAFVVDVESSVRGLPLSARRNRCRRRTSRRM